MRVDTDVLSPKRAAAYLGISLAAFNRGPRRELPVVQLTTQRIGFRRSDLEAWVSERTVAPAD